MKCFAGAKHEIFASKSEMLRQTQCYGSFSPERSKSNLIYELNSMKKKIFIDGRAELIILSEEERKDAAARARALNESDVAFLCLPDDAARESVSFIENDNTVVIDTSTAHRTLEGWCYGFPELSPAFADTAPFRSIISSVSI